MTRHRDPPDAVGVADCRSARLSSVMADWTSRRTSSTSATSRSGSATCSPTATPRAACRRCPDWRADDLLWHLGEVQHCWTWMVTNRPKGPDELRRARAARRPCRAAGVLRPSSYAALVDALAAADPTDEAWTWSPAPHRRVHPPPTGPRGADPPPRRRAGRRHDHAVPGRPRRRRRRRGARRDVRRVPALGRVLAAPPLHPGRPHRHRRPGLGAAGALPRHRPRRHRARRGRPPRRRRPRASSPTP